jgi:hypothetical protein
MAAANRGVGMPAYETMFLELIYKLRDDPEAVQQALALLQGGASLVDILTSLELVTHAGHAAFIATTPGSIQAAILAAVGQNLNRETPKQMLFSWAPGYDWELRLTESQSSVISDGGITFLVRSRYPGDPHPGTGT